MGVPQLSFFERTTSGSVMEAVPEDPISTEKGALHVMVGEMLSTTVTRVVQLEVSKPTEAVAVIVIGVAETSLHANDV